jgi:signal peptidase I
VITLVVRAFFVEPYRIPTPSMERTLLVGDFLFVSKLNYGARTPNTLGIPFTGIYLRGLEVPQVRLPGFSSVKRGDVAVFNLPPEAGPTERRTPYIKRLVALPGDRVLLLDKVLYVNDERYPLTAAQMQGWRVEPAPRQTLTPGTVRDAGLQLLGQVQHPTPSYVVNATPQQALEFGTRPEVGLVEPHILPEGIATGGIYPQASGYNRDNYGPLWIPAQGGTVELDERTWRAYREIIVRHEGRAAEILPDGTFLIDGEPATSYTFGQDYYFAMGDNRDNSEDSRFWGPVPHDHLVGKAVLVFFSLDLENRFLGFIPRLRLRGFQPIR